MYPRSFEYVCPSSVDEALEVMGEYGERASLLAGGQSLIPLMKMRLASPEVVVDLNRVSELGGVREDGQSVVIGAMTRHRELGDSPIARSLYPALADAAPLLTDPIVRNRGTVGGALDHADPASDWCTTLLALDASIEIRSAKSRRTMAIDGFSKDSFVTGLAPHELLYAVRVPKPAPHSGSAFTKLKRKTGDFATVSVAASATLDGHSAKRVRLALGGVAATPIRVSRAGKDLGGPSPLGRDDPRVGPSARAGVRSARASVRGSRAPRGA